MRAVVQARYGVVPEDVLGIAEMPPPPVGADDVLVHVHAASVDRGTWHIMTGLPYLIRFVGFGVRRPTAPNPGRSFAGTVEAVGGDVERLAAGDEVYGTAAGSFAQYVATPERLAARKPANLSFAEAAAVPVSATAALQAVRDVAHVSPDDQVLVIGAAGGVGGFAVQIAKAFGAEVTGVSGPGGAELVRALGADQVVDYTREEFADGERHYDVVIDTGGHRPLSQLRRALTTRGRLVIVGSETGGRVLGGFDRQIRARLLSRFVSQTLGTLASSENAGDLDVLRELIEDAKVSVVIDRRYPLAETAAALRYAVAGSTRGKVVIDVD